MGSFVPGYDLYGKVDFVSGRCYLATVFWHLSGMPIVPMGTYIIKEQTEYLNVFKGKPIALHAKSVVIGYLRGWLGAISLFTSLMASLGLSSFIFGREEPLAWVYLFAIAAVFAWSVWFVITTRRLLFVVVQGAFHGLAILVWLGYIWFIAPNPALIQARLPDFWCWPYLVIANVTLFFYSLTRLWSHASHARAAELIAILGSPSDLMTVRY
jgi:hypothetical protein